MQSYVLEKVEQAWRSSMFGLEDLAPVGLGPCILCILPPVLCYSWSLGLLLSCRTMTSQHMSEHGWWVWPLPLVLDWGEGREALLPGPRPLPCS